MSDCTPVIRAVMSASRAPARLARAAAAQRSAAAQVAAPEPVRWTNLADSYAPPPSPIPKPRPHVPQATPQPPLVSGKGCERATAASPAQAGGAPESDLADPSDHAAGQAPGPSPDLAAIPGTPRTAGYDRLADSRSARNLGPNAADAGGSKDGVPNSGTEPGDVTEIASGRIGSISTAVASGGVGLGAAAIASASGVGLLGTDGEGGTSARLPAAIPGARTPSGGSMLLTDTPIFLGQSDPASVPEPASMLIMAIGLAVLLLVHRRSWRMTKAS